MEKFEKLTETIRGMQPDIRLEVILADLLAAGISLEEVELISNSYFHRNYHRDIEEVSGNEPVAAGRSRLTFLLNRQGLYDLLPEDLFHQPGSVTGTAEKSKTLQELRDQTKIETQSRRFFLPVEQEFYRQRVRLESEERKFLFETSDNVPAGIFDLLWDLPDFLSETQKSRLGLLMPLLYLISGNISLMEAAMESVSGNRVSIRKTAPLKTRLPESPVLGKSALGKTTVLGGKLSSFQSGFLVQVNLPDEESLSGWSGTGKKRSLFEFLCTLLIPFDADLVIEPVIPENGSGFLLEDARSHCALLNFTTNI